ncbi:MAG: flavodoxin-dependent (E)-4-hydroxy-3-methylbut-2-enyl-diphosphate synthase, partial [Pseudonocardiaceae bacterium]
MSLLGRITGPTDFKGLSTATLAALAEEIRAFLIDKVSGAGGHLGPNLGAVELTIATHRVFDSPRDVLLFDTGHQAYLHKILTGRCAEFDSLRQAGGLSGYPSRAESVHDVIENSHASTALSYADGLAKAFALRGGAGRRVVAIIGDGALTGGMCWEALMWDASVLPVMPYLRLAAPRHCARLRELLREAIDIADGPTVIRYPQATAGPDIPASGRIGQCDILRDEPAAVSLLVAVGSLAGPCLAAADELAAHDVPVTVIDPRWVAPLDQALLKLAGAHRLPSRFLPARLPGPDPACSRPGRGRHRHRGAHTTRQHPPREDRSQGDLMTAVDLGMPAPPSAPAVRRRASRQVMVGGVPVGGDAPVSVQSMTTTRTSDIDATLQQIAELTAAGCQIVRVAVPSQDDANALPAIAAKSQIPVIADIHFQPRYVFAAIDAGCAAVRVNPGNIKKFDDKFKQIAAA